MSKVYPVSLAGESHNNPDGSSRQAEIRRSKVGEPVRLVRDPDNKHDSSAITCLSARGVGLGMVSRDHAVWLAECLDKGRDVRAIIADICKPERAKNYGLVLGVSVDGSDPKALVRDASFHAAERASSRMARDKQHPDKSVLRKLVTGMLRGLFK